ncbi:hypothetical protein Q9295_03995 [Xinfangfangia sp. CPCC 101601]|uniref:Spermidine synthase n=1 Tax=Pseudogemmobacter lacusdianii TaxID=3069608 RepID=A0ABU0VUW0_9RHOB|nr:hypothetical protein [Xinfangfangia sp. CPCC 101601]MDQ2065522.1 hypothetical protein [Xinfangfangia sp. CPCC 101601]
MTLWTPLARARSASGDDILLQQRGELFEIKFNGMQLMSNLNSQSEISLAIKAARMLNRHDARVLVGGLGMGFTLRAILDAVPQAERVDVCEISPEVAEWNRSHLAPLADHPLADRRVRLHLRDVSALLQENPKRWDLILMDTDNGPEALARPDNAGLYNDAGIAMALDALRPGGIAAFWSADRSDAFARRLDQAGAAWCVEDIPLIPGRADAMHHLYFVGSDRQSLAQRLAA